MKVAGADKVRILAPGPDAGPVLGLHVNETADRILVLDVDGELYANELPGGKIVPFPGLGRMRAPAIQPGALHPRGTHAAIINRAGKVVIQHLGQTLPRPVLANTGKAAALAWSPDGTRLAVTNDSGLIQVLDAATGKPVHAWEGLTAGPGLLAWSPDGSRLAVAAGSKVLLLNSEKPVNPPWAGDDQPSQVTCVAFMPDSQSWVTGSDSGRICWWKADSVKPMLVTQAHEGAITAMAVSADGTRLATAGTDKSVAMWETGTKKELARVRALNSPAAAVAFGPGGIDILYFGTRDGLVAEWGLEAAIKPLGRTP